MGGHIHRPRLAVVEKAFNPALGRLQYNYYTKSMFIGVSLQRSSRKFMRREEGLTGNDGVWEETTMVKNNQNTLNPCMKSKKKISTKKFNAKWFKMVTSYKSFSGLRFIRSKELNHLQWQKFPRSVYASYSETYVSEVKWSCCVHYQNIVKVHLVL